MTEEAEPRKRTSKKLWLVIAFLLFLLAIVLVPPMLSIGRYKSGITRLVSNSLGRPVRLSSVELRLLPRPGFVLTDLTVDEDPAFGAEPVLHANSVTAAIRPLSLLSGRLEISRISVDDASLNLVQTHEGRWNLDELFRTAAARSTGSGERRTMPLPFLEATNSRVHIKKGLEKLPFSVVNADISFWQENPGDWRLRLRGQPARTDVNLDLADTGIVRLEAILRRAPELRQMPIHVDMEWREAQLGQLSRLVLGSDPGWRGDLTGQMQVDGTAEAAQVKARLSATGVHRAEFAPADAMDFDANCTLIYHYSGRSVENLACDSPLGDGHIKLAGNLPASDPGKLAVEMQRVPVSATLDALRTLRNGIKDDLQARGTISGQLTYDEAADEAAVQNLAPARIPALKRPAFGRPAKKLVLAQGPLQGSLTIDSFRLAGASLSQPVQIAKITLAPAPAPQDSPQALAAAISLPAGGALPLAITVRLALSGYQVSVHGSVALPRLRELAHSAGVSDTSALDALAGEPGVLDLSASGPWIPPAEVALNSPEPSDSPAAPVHAIALENAGADQISGTVTLRSVNWRSDVLANHVEISQATLHVGRGALSWDPIAFSYGPVKGTARMQFAMRCEVVDQCPPQLNMHFDQLDTASLQAALLGAHQQGTVLSTLIARLTPSSTPVWPRFNATVNADSLVLGVVTLQNASVALKILPTGAEFTSIDAALFGGQLHATGKLTNGDKPAYELEGSFEKLQALPFCQLLATHCTGGLIDGHGKIALSGFADKDLAASATGALHLDWRRGSVISPDAPKAMAHFDRWTADAVIDHNAVTIKDNQAQLGARKSSVEATVTFGDPPEVSYGATRPAQTAKR